MLASLGKMPTTSARRLTSLLRRSSGLDFWLWLVFASSHCGLAVEPSQAGKVIGEVGKADLGPGAHQADGAHNQADNFLTGLARSANRARVTARCVRVELGTGKTRWLGSEQRKQIPQTRNATPNLRKIALFEAF
jgi:hypothetical protein